MYVEKKHFFQIPLSVNKMRSNKSICFLSCKTFSFMMSVRKFFDFFSCWQKKKVAVTEPEDYMPRCVYCRKIFTGTFDSRDPPPLTEAEAELVPRMCPYHFNMKYQRTPYSEPQDPNLICDMCTYFLRKYLRDCHLIGLEIRQFNGSI
ncbi:Hypothetical predicted protein [Cloeon dipterum]|uniref:Uncharacterized protein n=1 Tax=Cloeon dipterum TaxID=197152 RepID=A0A8S1DNL3_9INSE|nr:Hypothetical predicted protein [Cloeon dipterum]